MNTSQFRNIDPRDWFCAPGSHISSSRIYLTDCNQSVNFELLGCLAFHYMLFQTSGKKHPNCIFYFIALYLFVSVDVSSKTSLNVFFSISAALPNTIFYSFIPLYILQVFTHGFVHITYLVLFITVSLFASIDFKINTHKAFL